MADKGTLIVFSGPSGAGKDTVLEEFFKRKPQGVWKSISNTTRAPRDGETDGIDYNFITVDDFFNVVDNNGMVEYTKYGLNYYGTPKAPVDEHLANGDTIILKIEVEGAGNIKKLYPDAVGVFIMPPSLEVLENRLRRRGSENDEDVQRRMNIARNELKFKDNYEYHIVNDELEQAVNDLCDIVKALQK